MSSTYRQSSVTTDLNYKIDPENVYLSRFPRQKLSAEMIRDNFLKTSGLMVNKLGGPSVNHYSLRGFGMKLLVVVVEAWQSM